MNSHKHSVTTYNGHTNPVRSQQITPHVKLHHEFHTKRLQWHQEINTRLHFNKGESGQVWRSWNYAADPEGCINDSPRPAILPRKIQRWKCLWLVLSHFPRIVQRNKNRKHSVHSHSSGKIKLSVLFRVPCDHENGSRSQKPVSTSKSSTEVIIMHCFKHLA